MSWDSARRDAISSGVRRVGVPDAHVVVAGDFVSAIRRLTSDPGYGTTRGSGVVAAKTLPLGFGTVIVLNAREAERLDTSELERLAAHEGGHAHIYDRDEQFDQRRFRGGFAGGHGRWRLAVHGAMAMEEYRVERALVEVGYPGSEFSSDDDLEEMLATVGAEVADAVTDPDSANVAAFADKVMATHDWSSKRLAYRSAYDRSIPDFGAGPSFGSTLWDSYVGDSWLPRADTYDAVPSALEPLGAASLAGILPRLADMESRYLSRLGFEYRDTAAGTSFLRTVSDPVLTERVKTLMARAQGDALNS